jgi:hypothetical protein
VGTVTCGLEKKLDNEDLYDLYASPNNVMVI